MPTARDEKEPRKEPLTYRTSALPRWVWFRGNTHDETETETGLHLACLCPSRTKNSSRRTTPCRLISNSRRAASRCGWWTKRKGGFISKIPPGVGVWPLPYTQLGLPKDCARLVVLSLVDAPAVAAAGAACAREMMKLLGPCGAACFNVSRNAYHVSVFFFSLPNDPIADPLASDASEHGDALANETETNMMSESERMSMNRDGVDVSLATAPLAKIGGRFQPAHEDEARAAEAAAFEMHSNEIVLEVDRIACATSGALLLLFRDPNGDLERFRDALKTRFPNAPKKQPQIAHCTLLRAFPKNSDALTSGSSGRALADCRALCARWTARVRGTRVRVDRAWLVREERFSSIDGARRAFKFGGETERGLGA